VPPPCAPFEGRSGRPLFRRSTTFTSLTFVRSFVVFTPQAAPVMGELREEKSCEWRRERGRREKERRV
jgi:hypothetical protein